MYIMSGKVLIISEFYSIVGWFMNVLEIKCGDNYYFKFLMTEMDSENYWITILKIFGREK